MTTTSKLLAYLLDDLSQDERIEVEARLLIDAEWRAELERLEQCLAATGDVARCADEPPADLLTRTCSLVEHHCCDNHAHDAAGNPHSRAELAGSAPFSECRVGAGGCSRRKFSDFLVAAGVMLILASLVMPALNVGRTDSRKLACQDNLRWLGSKLFEIQERDQHQLPAVQPGQAAGLYSVMLVSRGGVDPREVAQHVVCPASQMAEAIAAGQVVLLIPTLPQWQEARGQHRIHMASQMGGDYAYSLGYYDARGEYHPIKFTGSRDRLLMADAPLVTPAGVMPVNHSGGQFVLDQSMCVRFRSNCVLNGSRDHIYLNDKGRHAAGLGADDTVLGRTDCAPEGLITPIDLPKIVK